jgi:hypothetical protein
VPELEIRECPPSTLRNVDDGPLGADDRDSGAPTINIKNVNDRHPGPRKGGSVPIRDPRSVL